MRSLEILQFGGIQNTNPPRSIPNNALADAVDVDINDAGNVLERLGADALPALSLPVEAAYTAQNGVSYVVSNDVLHRLNPDFSLTAIHPCTARAFADQDDYLFTNDGLMVYGDQAATIAIPVAPTPEVTVIPGSGPSGLIAATVTYQNDSGLMTAASPIVRAVLYDDSDILVTPQPTGLTANIWLTETYNDPKTGGEVFYNTADGSILPEIFLGADAFPGGHCIEWFDSRLFLAQQINANLSVINFSHRDHYHLYDLAQHYFIIPDTIHDMKATESALVLAGESGIYAYDGQSLSVLANYGCPAGRSIVKLPGLDALLIHSKRGFCQFPDFKNLTEKKVSLPAGSHCSTHIVHQRGMQQVVALHNGGEAFNKHT